MQGTISHLPLSQGRLSVLGAGDQGVEGQNWDGPCDNDKVREFPIMVLPICITGLTLVVTSLST